MKRIPSWRMTLSLERWCGYLSGHASSNKMEQIKGTNNTLSSKHITRTVAMHHYRHNKKQHG
eukprot:m.42325 g.42325  ORF g.42325 m.42325 type:complete len:62 (-) comp10672_c0_seq3:1321-1506(-)